MLLVVEGRRIVLEMLDQRAGLGPFVEHLGLALVDTTPPVHPRGPRNRVAWGSSYDPNRTILGWARLSHRSIGRKVQLREPGADTSGRGGQKQSDRRASLSWCGTPNPANP